MDNYLEYLFSVRVEGQLAIAICHGVTIGALETRTALRGINDP